MTAKLGWLKIGDLIGYINGYGSIRMKPLIAVLAAAVFFAGLGRLSADWRAKNADADIRDLLFLQAVQISRAIDPELAKMLSFTSEDQGTPAFERIREQMVAYGKLIPQRGIYSMALQDGKIVFGPENYAEDDPMASPPGTVYKEPEPENYMTFAGKKPIVVGPVTDEYGTFISALAPVYDPRSGEVLMVIGIDFLSDEWQAAVRAARRGPLIVTLIIIWVVLSGGAMIWWRNRLPEKQGVFLRHMETITVCILGLILTVSTALLVLEAEYRERSRIFIRSSYAMAEAVSDTFHDIKGDIAAIGRFKEGSIHIDKQEFIVFAEPMTRNSAVRGYQMVSFVSDMGKAGFESEIRRDGVEDFFIWERTLQGEKVAVSHRPCYYPVCYVAPWDDNSADVGFDLGSEPHLKTILEESIRTGLITAAELIHPAQETIKEPGMMILHPIFTANNPVAGSQDSTTTEQQLLGFAAGVIRLESILDVVLKKFSDEGLFVDMHLVDLTNKPEPAILAAYPRVDRDQYPVIMDRQYLVTHKHMMSYPLFVFGRPLAIVSHATPVFDELHPLWESRFIVIAGLFLTTGFTFFIGFVRNRQRDLESQVKMHTSAFVNSEKRFRVLFENAIYGVALHEIVLDENSKPNDYVFLEANPGFEKNTGLRVEDIVGKRVTDIFSGLQEAPFIDIYGRVALTGEPVTFEHFFEPLQRHFIINAYQVGWGRFATFLLDITEQKRSEEEKNKLQVQLAQAQKMEAVGRLAGGVAHDFNNMLSVILGYTEIALEKLTPSDPIREDLEEVIFASKRSAELVRQLMAFARRQVVSPVVLDLNDWVSQVLKMLQRLIGENIYLAWVPGHALWDIKIDPSQVDQLLANLMVNARDSIRGTGKVIIETQNKVLDQDFCKVHAGSKSGEHVLLMVSDNGCGMDKEIQAKIFEPFFTTKEIGKGTGLGLATVFGIVKQNNGYISVSSEPGRGTTFRIYLPRFKGMENPQ